MVGVLKVCVVEGLGFWGSGLWVWVLGFRF